MIIYIYYRAGYLDGFISGYYLKKFLLKRLEGSGSTTFISKPFFNEQFANENRFKNIIYTRPYNYRDKIDKDITNIHNYIAEGKQVFAYFVDCCPYEEVQYFEKLHALLNDNLVIIDHRKTAIEFIRKYEEERHVKVNSEISTDYAGCDLTMMYIESQKKEFRPYYSLRYEKLFQYWLRTQPRRTSMGKMAK
jgi:hypothetical protein